MTDNDALLKTSLKRTDLSVPLWKRDWDNMVASLKEDLGEFAEVVGALVKLGLVLAVGFGVLLALVWAVRLAIRITA